MWPQLFLLVMAFPAWFLAVASRMRTSGLAKTWPEAVWGGVQVVGVLVLFGFGLYLVELLRRGKRAQ